MRNISWNKQRWSEERKDENCWYLEQCRDGRPGTAVAIKVDTQKHPTSPHWIDGTGTWLWNWRMHLFLHYHLPLIITNLHNCYWPNTWILLILLQVSRTSDSVTTVYHVCRQLWFTNTSYPHQVCTSASGHIIYVIIWYHTYHIDKKIYDNQNMPMAMPNLYM